MQFKVFRYDLPINKFKHFLENAKQDPASLDLPYLVLLSLRQAQNFLELSDQFVENIRIHQAKHNKESRADRGANDTPDRAKAVEARGDGGCCGGYHD